MARTPARTPATRSAGCGSSRGPARTRLRSSVRDGHASTRRQRGRSPPPSGTGHTNTFGSKKILSFPVSGPDGITAQNPPHHRRDRHRLRPRRDQRRRGGRRVGHADAGLAEHRQDVRRLGRTGEHLQPTWAPATPCAGSARRPRSSADTMMPGDRGRERADLHAPTTTATAGPSRRSRPPPTQHPDRLRERGQQPALRRRLGPRRGREQRAPRVLGHGRASGTAPRTTLGATWSGEQTLTTLYQAYWVQLERDPSNVVHLVVMDEASDLRAWKWTAGAWTVTTTPIAALDEPREQQHQPERRDASRLRRGRRWRAPPRR